MSGTVDIYINRKLKNNASTNKVVINSKLAQEYLKSFKKLAKELKLNDAIRFEIISRQPDVITVEEQDGLNSHEVALLKKAFDAALKKLDIEKSREGLALKKDLQKNLKELQRYIQKISKLRDEANKVLQQKFENKIKSRLPKEAAGHGVDAQRITQEIVIQLEKADINEELTRLAEHTKNFEKITELEKENS